jgi:hypothetical protein
MGAYERPTIANPACNPAPAADVSQQQGTPAQGGGQQGGGGGAAALRLSAVGYKKGKLSFTLNYATKLQLKVDRKKPRILSVKAGKNVLKLRLKPGRHKLQLAGAGVSKTLSVRVR